MHFDVISCSHEYFSRISTLLEGNSTVLAVGSAFNTPSIEGVNVPGFNKLVRFRRFEKCKIQNFSGGACHRTPLDEARSANKLLFGKPQT